MVTAELSGCLAFFAVLILMAVSQQQAENKAALQVQSFLRSGIPRHSGFISPSSGGIASSLHVGRAAAGLFTSWQKGLFLFM